MQNEIGLIYGQIRSAFYFAHRNPCMKFALFLHGICIFCIDITEQSCIIVLGLALLNFLFNYLHRAAGGIDNADWQ